jgi:hypothetical protein
MNGGLAPNEQPKGGGRNNYLQEKKKNITRANLP